MVSVSLVVKMVMNSSIQFIQKYSVIGSMEKKKVRGVEDFVSLLRELTIWWDKN